MEPVCLPNPFQPVPSEPFSLFGSYRLVSEHAARTHGILSQTVFDPLECRVKGVRRRVALCLDATRQIASDLIFGSVRQCTLL
jgi:hypothetical protein